MSSKNLAPSKRSAYETGQLSQSSTSASESSHSEFKYVAFSKSSFCALTRGSGLKLRQTLTRNLSHIRNTQEITVESNVQRHPMSKDLQFWIPRIFSYLITARSTMLLMWQRRSNIVCPFLKVLHKQNLRLTTRCLSVCWLMSIVPVCKYH